MQAGNGYNLMQLCWMGEAYTLTADIFTNGGRETIKSTVMDYLTERGVQ
jgi:hypothetical protein